LTCSSLDPKQDPKIHAGSISGGQVRRATIVKHRDCPEADLAAMKARLEREWKGRYSD
jgi:hypothetical protein